ncbi:hypothetical protein DXG01_006108 [Tephrocybe rancida]|nr:hypothetical protein DXG01_006108 [Tephrocybe rancida]
MHRIEFEVTKSNDIVLSHVEAAETLRTIQTAEDRITALQNEISCQELHIQRLRIALAPHRALPPEILAEIFTHVSNEEAYVFYYPRTSDVWRFKQVCSRWRQVAMRSSVWNSIILVSTRRRPAKELQNVDFWLRHVAYRALPLSISAGDGDAIYWKVLKPYHLRLESLDMKVEPELFQMPRDSFPRLKSLALRWSDETFQQSYDSYKESLCFVGMGRLRSLELDFDDVQFNQRQALPTTVPWDQLTSLVLSGSSGYMATDLSNILEVLARCACLEHLSTQLHVGERAFGGLPSVTMPCLTSLKFDKDLSLLNFIIAPALDTLTIPPPNTSVDTFLLRSQCALHTLNITGGRSDTDTIVYFANHVLDTVQSLRVLNARQLYIPPFAIKEIADGGLLPHIERLRARVGDLNDVGILAELVKRRPQCAPRGVQEIDVGVRIRLNVLHERKIRAIFEGISQFGTYMKVSGGKITVATCQRTHIE